MLVLFLMWSEKKHELIKTSIEFNWNETSLLGMKKKRVIIITKIHKNQMHVQHLCFLCHDQNKLKCQQNGRYCAVNKTRLKHKAFFFILPFFSGFN